MDKYVACYVALGFLGMATCTMAENSLGNVGFSGSILTVADVFQQGTLRNTQFDQALNLNINVTFNAQLTAQAQLQGGPGGGFIGFNGPGLSVSQLYVAYAPTVTDTWTLGAFAQPLGQSASRLSINADGGNNAFLINSLAYSALMTAVGNLNTLGVGWQRNGEAWTWNAALSNGPGVTAANPAATFEGLLNMQVQPGDGPWVFSGTYMQSDAGPSGNAGNTFSMWMADVSFQDDANPWTGIAYIGQFSYNDGNATTSDGVGIASAELAYDFTPALYVSARWSGWLPTDSDGNGVGVSAGIPNPGYAVAHDAYTVVTDQRIDRYQIGVGQYWTSVVLAKAEVVADIYQHGEDVVAVIGSLNFFF
jgi:hypothetical protein